MIYTRPLLALALLALEPFHGAKTGRLLSSLRVLYSCLLEHGEGDGLLLHLEPGIAAHLRLKERQT